VVTWPKRDNVTTFLLFEHLFSQPNPIERSKKMDTMEQMASTEAIITPEKKMKQSKEITTNTARRYGELVSQAEFYCKEKLILLLSVLLVGLAVSSLLMGRYALTIGEVTNALWLTGIGQIADVPKEVGIVLFHLRLPRILGDMVIGGALALSGAAYQGLFKNPMASPTLLGASGGAGFGAAVGILLSLNVIGVQLMSFGFGVVAVLLTCFINLLVSEKTSATSTLLLAGILVSTVFNSLIMLAKYVADAENKLPAITFWLMGSLSSLSLQDLMVALLPIGLGGSLLYILKWQINVLSFGDETAQTLGVNVKIVRAIVIISATMVTAACVAVSGIIGWVGLVIPHLTRMLTGPNYKKLIPVSMLMGSIYLLMIDNLARTMTQVELPLGILTSLIGAPLFVVIMLRQKKQREQ
jgi:iron complex transport system permease protein